MIRILIAEDHDMVRQGLVSLLVRENTFSIEAQVKDGIEALEKAKALKPDILLLDLTLPRLHGLDVLSALRTQKTTRTIVLTMHSDHASVLESFRLGARAYVKKDSPFADLISAIHEVAKDGWWVSPQFEPMLRETALAKQVARPSIAKATLTRREQIVLQAVGEGKSNSMIAEQLGVSPRTVEKHRGNAMRRLGLHSEAEVVRYTVRHALVHL